MSFKLKTGQFQFVATQQIRTRLAALGTLKPIVVDWKCPTAFCTAGNGR